jgi:hypothetical protein
MVAHHTNFKLESFLQLIFAVFLQLLFSDVTCVHTMQVLAVFNCSEVRPEVVLAARWRRGVNLKSPIDSPTTVCN